MLKDHERYIFTTEKSSVMRDVLSFVFAAVGPEPDVTPDTYISLEVFAQGGCDRMILELRRPKGTPVRTHPWVRKLRVRRLGRMLVVTGDATSPEILNEIEELRSFHFIPRHLTSGLRAFGRTVFGTMRPAHPQN